MEDKEYVFLDHYDVCGNLLCLGLREGMGGEQKVDYTKGEWRCTHCGSVNAGYGGWHRTPRGAVKGPRD